MNAKHAHSGRRLCHKLFAAGLLTSTAAAHATPQETTIYTFSGVSGGNVHGQLLLSQGPDGAARALYGGNGSATGGNAFVLTPPAGGAGPWIETTLHAFTNGADGGGPGDPILDPGKLATAPVIYGATSGGGTTGSGTIYALSNGVLTTLYNFTNGADGSGPSNVVADASGALYAVTFQGGTTGCGAVVRLAPPRAGQTAWTGTVIYSVGTGSGKNAGCNGLSLAYGKDGSLYGTTNNFGRPYGGGVFRLVPPAKGSTVWKPQTLLNFGSLGIGLGYGQVLAGNNGELYGTAYNGGADGGGAIYEITPPSAGSHGWTSSIIWTFTDSSQPYAPLGGLIEDRNGTLYGTGAGGGADGQGGIFKLSPPTGGGTTWTFATVWSFTGGAGGDYAFSKLVADGTGALYGTTNYGGGSGCGGGCGIAYEITGSGFVP